MAAPSTPAGWYKRPTNEAEERFWDGKEWTGQVRAALAQEPPPRISVTPAPSDALGAPQSGLVKKARPAKPKRTKKEVDDLIKGVIVVGFLAFLGIGWLIGGSSSHSDYKAPATFTVSNESVAHATEEAVNHTGGGTSLAAFPTVRCSGETSCNIKYNVQEPFGLNTGAELIEPTRQLWKAMFEDPEFQEATIVVSGPTVTTGGQHGTGEYFVLKCNRSDEAGIDWDTVEASGIEELCEYEKKSL